jgi:hypothetical protein
MNLLMLKLSYSVFCYATGDSSFRFAPFGMTILLFKVRKQRRFAAANRLCFPCDPKIASVIPSDSEESSGVFPTIINIIFLEESPSILQFIPFTSNFLNET